MYWECITDMERMAAVVENKIQTNAGSLQPGQVIRPSVSKETATELAFNIYGLKVATVQEFDSYDDRNFYLQVENEHANPHIQQLHPDGYILKITNSFDSQNPDIIDAHNSLMLYLYNQNLTINIPIQNIHGDLKSLEKITAPGAAHSSYNMVRLLTFLKGDILYKVKFTSKLCFQVGKLAATIDNALQEFKHSGYDTHQSIWMLSNAPDIRKFVFAVQNAERLRLVEEILQDFERHVLSNVENFPKGIIHGDLNEQNIIVRKLDTSEELEIYGVLDVGDSHYNCYVFELALAATYMMLMGDDDEFLEFGGQVIAGFLSERSISGLEWQALKCCVETRYCQSLVMGAYTHHQDPGNTYVLTTSHKGWKQLEKLRRLSQNDLYDVWKVHINKHSLNVPVI